MISSKSGQVRFELCWIISLGITFLGMFRMPALMSIGMINICLLTIWAIKQKRILIEFKWVYGWGIMFFLWMAFSFFWSEDKTYYLERMRIKLPILLGCICCIYAPYISKRYVNILLKGLLIAMCLSTLPSVWVYSQLKEYYDGLYLYGNTFPVPFSSHIRYGLMLVVAFQFAFYLFTETKSKWYIVLMVYLFCFLHLLAVRSSLVTLYISIVVLVIYIIVYYKKVLLGILSVVFLCIVLIIAYYQVNSFRNKINYTKWGIMQLAQNNKSESSDEGRFISLQYGIDIFKSNLLLGVGEGDLLNEMNKKYAASANSGTYYKTNMPHNQFVWTGAASGLLGLLLLGLFLVFCVREAFIRKNVSMIMFIFTVIGSMMVEQTWETQLGMTFFILPFLIYAKMES